jgi:hypothetical protein
VDSSFDNGHCCVTHHLRVTAKEKLSVGKIFIELFIFEAKKQMIRHGDVKWPQRKLIQFMMLKSNSVTTCSRYGALVSHHF